MFMRNVILCLITLAETILLAWDRGIMLLLELFYKTTTDSNDNNDKCLEICTFLLFVQISA